MDHPGRQALRAALAHPVDLVGAALAVAQEDLDLTDTRATRDALDRLAARAAEQLGPPTTPAVYAARLIQYLHGFEGYHGDADDYSAAANSYLPLVHERRVGLPITLGLIVLHVGWQLGLPLRPAALPGHFMVRWDTADDSLFLDLFWGQVLDRRGCQAFLEVQTGSSVPDPALLPATTSRAVIARLLRNLKYTFVNQREFDRALAAAERIMLVVPGAGEDLRDRGMLRLRTGDLHRGLHDLERYVAAAPASFDQPFLRQQVQSITGLIQGRS